MRGHVTTGRKFFEMVTWPQGIGKFWEWSRDYHISALYPKILTWSRDYHMSTVYSEVFDDLKWVLVGDSEIFEKVNDLKWALIGDDSWGWVSITEWALVRKLTWSEYWLVVMVQVSTGWWLWFKWVLIGGYG